MATETEQERLVRYRAEWERNHRCHGVMFDEYLVGKVAWKEDTLVRQSEQMRQYAVIQREIKDDLNGLVEKVVHMQDQFDGSPEHAHVRALLEGLSNDIARINDF